MFEYLKGKIEYKKPDYVALDINGLGYKVYISLRTYDAISIGEELKFYTYNYIKEDTYKVIGFLEEKDRKIFELLLSVNGIGVSLALSIMSTFSSDKIRSLILSDDYISLKKVPKLGDKKAQQLILDLKNKFKNLKEEIHIDDIDYSSIEEDLNFALESLGYSSKEIKNLVDRNELKSYTNVEEAIKSILKKIRIDGM